KPVPHLPLGIQPSRGECALLLRPGRRNPSRREYWNAWFTGCRLGSRPGRKREPVEHGDFSEVLIMREMSVAIIVAFRCYSASYFSVTINSGFAVHSLVAPFHAAEEGLGLAEAGFSALGACYHCFGGI